MKLTANSFLKFYDFWILILIIYLFYFSFELIYLEPYETLVQLFGRGTGLVQIFFWMTLWLSPIIPTFLFFRKFRKIVVLYLFFSNIILLNVNERLFMPETNLIGWFFLSIFFIEMKSDPKERVKLIRQISFLGLAIVSLIYFLGALNKISTPSWQSGIALYQVVNSPVGSRFGKVLNSTLGKEIFLILNFSAIIVQLMFPLIFFKKTKRLFLIFLFLFFQTGGLILFRIYQINLGMILIHLFHLFSCFELEDENLLKV